MTAHSTHCTLPGCDVSALPPYRYTNPGAWIREDSGAQCRYCNSRDDLVTGDGLTRPVCRPCIEVLCRIVRDPEAIDGGRAADEMAARHADVVSLVVHPGHPRAWAWSADWPGVAERAA